MPTYVYRREDGSTFEIQQRITEDPLTACPTTGQAVSRVITGSAGLIFKGSGFYLTDYARNGGDAKGKETKKGEAKSDTTSKASSDSDSKAASTTASSSSSDS